MQKYLDQHGYYVTPCGKVWSCKRKKFLKPSDNGHGYLIIRLGKDIKRYLHRLVAECWIDNPDNLPQVNHKDENKKNNKVDNLNWCTSQYNNAYSFGKKVIDLETNKVYDSIHEVARGLNISYSVAYRALNKPNYKGRYKLKYI